MLCINLNCIAQPSVDDGELIVDSRDQTFTNMPLFCGGTLETESNQMCDLNRVIFEGAEVPIALNLDGENEGWVEFRINEIWQRLREADDSDRANILAEVEFEVAIMFHYSGKPKHYGTNNPEEMCKIDLEQMNWPELIGAQFGSAITGDVQVTIKPRDLSR